MPYRIENGRARCLLCTGDVTVDNRSAAKVAHDSLHVAFNTHLRDVRKEGNAAPA